MSRVSIGRSHPRSCSGEKTLRRCRNNEGIDNVTLIDVDSYPFDNVIIVDVPEPFPGKCQGQSAPRKEKKFPSGNVIYIDDDETPDNNHSGSGVQNDKFFAGASSGLKHDTAAEDIADTAAEEQIKEKVAPVRLSKCKRTYSDQASTRNLYGLSSDSESDSSDDDDYPDCVLMEDSSGKVHEEWEKAFFRRRKDIHSGHSDGRDPESSSRGMDENHHQNVEANFETRQHNQAPFSSSTGKFNKDYEVPLSFSAKENDSVNYIYSDPTAATKTPGAMKTPLNDSKSDADYQTEYRAKDSHVIHPEQEGRPDCEPGTSSRNMEERWTHPASNSAQWRQSTKEVNHPDPTFGDEETSYADAYPSLSESSEDDDSCLGKFYGLDDEVTMSNCQSPFENEVDSGSSFPRDNQKNSQWINDESIKGKDHLKSSQPHATGTGTDIDKLVFQKSLLSKFMLPDKQTNPDCVPSIDAERHLNYQLHQNEDCLHSKDSCLIGEREKLKETDEYKRAIEEEWASRQQALQIQSEEAQRLKRLRKRRKAESIRLMDMERRQKQRVEEMRNSQKKDEENMNLKEAIRAEVQEELKKVEISCHNMASLLTSLGVRVGGWPSPAAQEVQTAYKRALLTFHPDRASRSDIRQQVEAEEKFKLVNRLKEKFLPSL